MNDRVGAGDHLVTLAEIGQIGQDAQAVRRAVMSHVDVEHLMTPVAEVAHDPTPCFAAATGYDDSHRNLPENAIV